VPETLAAIGRTAAPRADRLRAAAGRLTDAADALAAIGEPAAPAVRALGADLSRHAAAGAALDGWAMAVGARFEAADPTGPSLGPDALVFGDLASAVHVAVLVPGMGAALPLDGSDTAARAQQLLAAACAIDPWTAVVAWRGYEPPALAGALLDDAADAGSAALAEFVDGLDRAVDVTVVAHSYGTLVTAAALRHGMRVDDVVLLGGPGVEAHDANELPLHGASLSVERAPLDGVALSEAFGPDPADPRFGAMRLATGSAAGHSEYFDAGTLALANVAAVVTQRDDLLVPVAPARTERVVGAIDDAWALTVEAPVDSAQGAALACDASLGALEALAPSGPWDGAVAAEQAARGALLEEASRVVDVAQRAVSPDGAADLLRDAWDVISGATE
jgi:hypothetical protein